MRGLFGVMLVLVARGSHAQQPPTGGPVIMVPTVSVPGSVQNSLKIQPSQLTTLLAQALMVARVGDVKTEEDIKTVVQQNAQQQLLGCQDMRCVLDLGKLAGADLLVRGEVGMVGTRLLVSASLINVGETRVVGIVTRAVTPESLATGGLNPLAADLFPGLAQPVAGAENLQNAVSTAAPLGAQNVPPAPTATRERVVVTGQVWKDVDPSVRATALNKSAEVVNTAGGFQAVSTEEIKAVLQNEADIQMLGAGDANTVHKVADAVKAAFLVQMELGRAGRAWVMGASLIDTKTVEVVNRSSLVFQEEKQLLDAVNVVTRRLLGQSATLPTPDADPSRLETRLQAMMNDALGKYRELPQGGAAGLSIVPFGETTPELRKRKLGTQLATFVQSLGTSSTGITLVGKDKVKELNKQHDMANPLALTAQELGEMGVYLGAQAMLLGTVGDLGTDYLVQLRLVKVAGGSALWSGNAMFPKAKPGSLLPKKVVISRSRADAITRAVVPGLAQFTNGPLGIVKGAVFVGAIVAPLLLVIPALAASAFGWLFYYANQDVIQAGNEIPFLSQTYSVQADFGGDVSCATGGGGKKGDALDQQHKSECGPYQQLGIGVGAAAIVAAIALVVMGVIPYALSFIDAGIFGIKSEEVDFESAE